MELVLIRHALPLRVENPEGQPADPALSSEGREQARRLAKWLERERFDALYASPMRRAHETSLPLGEALGLPVALEPGVVEIDAESSVYIPLEELRTLDPARFAELIAGGLFAELDLPGFRRRVVAALEGLVRRHPGGRVAIVSHGGVINAWAGHVLGIDAPFFFSPDYTSLHRFLAARSGPRTLVSLNETAHLRG